MAPSAEVAVPRQIENIISVKSRPWTSPVPERYLHPASKLGSINGKSGVTLPVVDMTGFSSGDSAARKEIVRQIGSAASKWGFFQVVNHGIPEEKLGMVYQQARNFFELPVDVKERAFEPLELLHGYNGRFSHRVKEVPWLEFLAQWYRPTPQLDALAEKIWPGGNTTFCNVVHEFCQSADSLGKQLLELLAESLSLKPDTFSKEFQDPANYRSTWRLHHFPACPDPSRCLGAAPHSDSGVLTILKQDAIGGLQIREGDGFVDVTPIPGALVVNIGDTLQVWSNGRFRSSDHRVVVNGKSDRISMVYLFAAPLDFVIQCPPELVDEAHPSLYVPFTYAEFRANFERLLRNGTVGRKNTLAFALRKQTEDQSDNPFVLQ